MLVDLIVGRFVDLPTEVFAWAFRRPACANCSNLLKREERAKMGELQCVMCDRCWRNEGRTLLPVDSDD
jgi:hypothetical protein